MPVISKKEDQVARTKSVAQILEEYPPQVLMDLFAHGVSLEEAMRTLRDYGEEEMAERIGKLMLPGFTTAQEGDEPVWIVRFQEDGSGLRIEEDSDGEFRTVEVLESVEPTAPKRVDILPSLIISSSVSSVAAVPIQGLDLGQTAFAVAAMGMAGTEIQEVVIQLAKHWNVHADDIIALGRQMETRFAKASYVPAGHSISGTNMEVEWNGHRWLWVTGPEGLVLQVEYLPPDSVGRSKVYAMDNAGVITKS